MKSSLAGKIVQLTGLLLLGCGFLIADDEPIPRVIRPPVKLDAPISTIAFGSCVKEDRKQLIWEAVLKESPKTFIFLGDNIYGDTEDMTVLRAKWNKLGSDPGVQRLRATTPILATWDDHDFGENDAGAEYPKKRESQQIFLDFLGEPADSPRRKQEGVYSATMLGPPGQQVQVILLDTRYHRSPLKKSGVTRQPGVPYFGPYADNADPAAVILGEEQWKWLEQELRKPAQFRLLCSSIQVIANEHHWEKWGNFIDEHKRLYRLLRETKAGGVIVLSGDRHHAEVSRDGEAIGYPLIDITSSSLNQPQKPVNEPNRHRVGRLYELMNFGLLQFDWSGNDPKVTAEIRGLFGEVIESHVIRLSELQPK